MSIDYANHAGGERRCVGCHQTFNLDEGGQDHNAEADGPLCIRCEDNMNIQEMRAAAEAMDLDEPIEIVIDTLRDSANGKWVLAAWNHGGLVGHSLTRDGHGIGNALSSIGGRSLPLWPNKAVEGWQSEVLAFAEAGYGTVESVR